MKQVFWDIKYMYYGCINITFFYSIRKQYQNQSMHKQVYENFLYMQYQINSLSFKLKKNQWIAVI